MKRDSLKIDWQSVDRVLVVRLRSIGDTVLSTPALIALKRFLPSSEIDILLEDWVAPVLEGFQDVDRVIKVGRTNRERIKLARQLRRRRYDVVFNLHGGTTSTFLTRAAGASHRVGYGSYQYSYFYNHKQGPASDFWGTESTHSAEQQLALLGWVGVPVEDRPGSRLDVTDEARRSVQERLSSFASGGRIALLHPAAAFATKRWAVEKFAEVADHLAGCGLMPVAISGPGDEAVLRELQSATKTGIATFSDLTLPEVTALSDYARIFIGNDSGIAHIAAAVSTTSVVIFGSSNRDHWRPWTTRSYKMVYEEFDCQPCPGHECRAFGKPRCILEVSTSDVIRAVDELLATG